MPNSNFDSYFDLEGNDIFVGNTTAAETEVSVYGSEDIPYLVTDDTEGDAVNFVEKNEALALWVGNTSFAKVPAKRIYFWKNKSSGRRRDVTIKGTSNVLMDQDISFRDETTNPSIPYTDILGNVTNKPFTIVVPDGDLTIRGSFNQDD